jgi:hypothetical protein
LIGEPGGKRLGKPRSRWEDKVKLDYKKIWREVVEGVYLSRERDRQQAVVNTVMNLQVP